MSLKTLPNAVITDTWSIVAENLTKADIQLLGHAPVAIFIGAAAPTSDSMSGHVLRSSTRDLLSFTGLTDQKLFARVATGSPKSVLAVTTDGIPFTPLRVVTTRGEIESASIAAARTSSNNSQRARMRVHIGAGGLEANSFRLVLSAFYGSLDEGADGYDVRAHLEVGGVTYPLTWSGNATGTVPFGAARYVSDAATHPNVPAGTEAFLVIARTYAVGGRPVFFSPTAFSPANGDQLQHSTAGTDPQIGTAGAFTTSTGWTNSPGILAVPFVAIGRAINKAVPAIGVVGASIERGAADLIGDGVNGAGGYIRRGLWPSSGTKQAAGIMAVAGEAANTFLANSAKRREYLQYFDVLLIGYGGNDYSGGRTSSETLADIITIADLGKAAGVKRVGFLRMAPKSTSTDSFATTTGQTVRPNFLEFRSAIDAGVQAAGMTLVDVATTLEASPGIWKANLTSDGVHPLPAGHALTAPALQGAMGTLLAPMA